MGVRIAVALALFAALALLAWWLERRRRTDAPTQPGAGAPVHLDRHDFARPDAPWLVVLFTSAGCESCDGLYEKAAPLASSDVAVEEVEYTAHRALHERYRIDVAPMTLVADREGVVQATFLGAFNATELWNTVAELRA